MNTWYFLDKSDEPAKKLRVAVAAWRGTPFAPGQGAKGAGCDCLHLVPALLKECGVEYALNTGRYSIQETYHREDSRLLAALRAEPRLVEFPATEKPMLGDIAAFRIGNGVHHLGLVLDPPAFVQCVEKFGVSLARLDDTTWKNRLHGFFRIKAD